MMLNRKFVHYISESDDSVNSHRPSVAAMHYFHNKRFILCAGTNVLVFILRDGMPSTSSKLNHLVLLSYHHTIISLYDSIKYHPVSVPAFLVLVSSARVPSLKILLPINDAVQPVP